ncbi:hypothetical protein DFP73DRAFT_291559 [Morchella snyderi]|nr:hypothetical protein DFP73DRAFT_291559 [Morchella snyderi]
MGVWHSLRVISLVDSGLFSYCLIPKYVFLSPGWVPFAFRFILLGFAQTLSFFGCSIPPDRIADPNSWYIEGFTYSRVSSPNELHSSLVYPIVYLYVVRFFYVCSLLTPFSLPRMLAICNCTCLCGYLISSPDLLSLLCS